jgi:uncharacterized repeat protein (TIGR03899 family)
MAEFNLVKFDGKPFEKLLEVISMGVGKIYKPRGIRKEADAEAYRIGVVERAKAKASAEGNEIEFAMYEKIQERILFKETKRQNNIDSVSQIVAEQLLQEKTVSDEPVNEDWTTRFFNIIEDVTDEQMQGLWGRILAGEVKQPESYSLRTLEILKNMNKREADIFANFANYLIESDKNAIIFRGKNSPALEENGFPFNDRLLMIELGLLQSGIDIVGNFPVCQEDIVHYFTSGKYIIKSIKKTNSPVADIPIFKFTKSGEELLKLIHIEPCESYIKTFFSYLVKSGFETEYSFIIEKFPDEKIRHTQPWQKF